VTAVITFAFTFLSHIMAYVVTLTMPSSMRLFRNATKLFLVFVAFDRGVRRSGMMMVFISPDTILGRTSLVKP